MEAGVRLRDLRHMPAHLDLCRPFAAHCIGYPVVTLGFGFKSYVGYRMRKRRQQEVARENSFYMQLLQQALPPHEDNSQQQVNFYYADLFSKYEKTVERNISFFSLRSKNWTRVELFPLKKLPNLILPKNR